MKFEFNEYVWDRVWDGPAIVVCVDDRDPDDPKPYVVGEITRADKSLHRMACRTEEELCRYVSIKIPEDEALILVRGVDADEHKGAWSRGQDRIREGLELRGISIMEEKT